MKRFEAIAMGEKRTDLPDFKSGVEILRGFLSYNEICKQVSSSCLSYGELAEQVSGSGLTNLKLSE